MCGEAAKGQFGSFVKNEIFKASRGRLKWIVYCRFDLRFLRGVGLLVVDGEHLLSKVPEERTVIGDLRVYLCIEDRDTEL